jgi:hypothetical protein
MTLQFENNRLVYDPLNPLKGKIPPQGGGKENVAKNCFINQMKAQNKK